MRLAPVRIALITALLAAASPGIADGARADPLPPESITAGAVALPPVRSGIAPAYLWQSIRGHLSIRWSARTLDDLLGDSSTPASLRQQLELARRLRRFASESLGLPDNGSFTRFAQIDRPYALWNVQAAPELSLEPVRWCFPFVGCVAYRGYYRREDAEGLAAGLRAEGLDVQVSGVAAYSTLGWFDDLLLSSFIAYPEPELAQLIFHELAHQVVWVQGDTRFNESFATAVELISVRRWLEHTVAEPALLEAWLARRERRQTIVALLADSAGRLRDLYRTALADDQKRLERRQVFTDLRAAFAALRARSPEFAVWDRWFEQDLGNAHLMSVGLYHDLVPAFLGLYREQGQNLPRFYEAARALGALDPVQRAARLAALAGLR